MNSKELFLQQFANLGSPDKMLSQQANQYILQLQASHESIEIAKSILDTPAASADHQFIACQLIYRKLKNQADKALMPYLLSLLDRELAQIAKNQICSSIALIIVEDKDLWPTILDQLIQLMQQRLLVGLEILTQIAIQGKEIFTKVKQIQLQSHFRGESEKLSTIFKELLIMQDLTIVNATLICISAWVEMNYQLFADQGLSKILSDLCTQALVNRANDFANRVFEVLSQAVGFSEYKDQEIINSIETNVVNTIRSFFQFILYIYNQQIQKPYAIMATKFAIDFMYFYFDTPLEEQVIRLMISISQHPSKSISAQTFEYWTELQRKGRLLSNGEQLIQSLIEKCKLKSIILTKEFLSGEPEECDERESRELMVMSTQDYREQAGDVFYNVFNGLTDAGLQNRYFEVILQNIQQQQDNKAQKILQIEAALFAMKSIIDNTKLKSDNQFVYQILNLVLQLPPEDTDIIMMTALQTFSELTTQYKLFNDLFSNSVRFMLRYMVHSKLGPLAAAAFEQISQQVDTIPPEMLMECIQLLETQLKQLRSKSQIENFVTSIMNLAVKIENIEAIQRLFTFINNSFQSSNLVITEEEFALNTILVMAPLSWVNCHIERIAPQVKMLSDQLCLSIMKPLIDMVSNCQNGNLYECVFDLFRIVIRVTNYEQQADAIVVVLSLTLRIISQDPIQRASWLTLLSLATSRSNENPAIRQWIVMNMESIHSFVLEQHQHWQDPDLIKYYAELLKSTLQADSALLLGSPNLGIVIKAICDSLLSINSYEMHREVFNFFRSFTQYVQPQNPAYMGSLTYILQTLFYGLQDFNPAILYMIQHMLVNLLEQQMDSNFIEVNILQGLQQGWGKDKAIGNLTLITKCVMKFAVEAAKTKQQNRDLKLLLTRLRPMNQDEINYKQLEISLRM